MQHEIVVRPATPSGSNWIEPSRRNDLEHRLRPARDGARRREQVARDEEASCGVGRDLQEPTLATSRRRGVTLDTAASAPDYWAGPVPSVIVAVWLVPN